MSNPFLQDACSCGRADWCCPTGGVAGFHGIADDQMGRGGEGIEMYGNTGFCGVIRSYKRLDKEVIVD